MNFNFVWTPNVSSSSVATNLKPGNYTLEVAPKTNARDTTIYEFEIRDIGKKIHSLFRSLLLLGNDHTPWLDQALSRL